MDWNQLYQEKLTTAAQAASVVESGDWIDYGWCACTSDVIDRALAERYEELEDVKVRGGILLKKPAIMSVPDAKDHFTWNSWHMTGIERKMIAEGGTFYAPVRYSELPYYYEQNIGKTIKAAFFQVSPMDKHGWFSFGPNASHMVQLCDCCEYIFLEVNDQVPRCHGLSGEGIHISQVTGVVETDNPALGEIVPGAFSDTDRKVAELIVKEIPDGACLQLGIGGMPNAVGSMIAESDLKHLGVHTEMYVDAFVDMALAGKIDGSKKSIDRGKQVYAFGAGTKKLYDFLDDNPECQGAPVSYTNDTAVIASIDNFMSINNAIDLDLFGQVNAESVGTRHISGAGGQQDFVMGAYRSDGGKSFICCSATVTGKDGTVSSRIIPTLREGSIATCTRTNIQYLVTEYGIVNLKGASTWERAEKIISVCHPDFRDDLIKKAEELKIWRRSNKR